MGKSNQCNKSLNYGLAKAVRDRKEVLRLRAIKMYYTLFGEGADVYIKSHSAYKVCM